jgi:hypothetical protein
MGSLAASYFGGIGIIGYRSRACQAGVPEKIMTIVTARTAIF